MGREEIQSYFETAKRVLKGVFGLDLTLIEQVALRIIARDSYKKNLKLRGWSGFSPASDACARFMLNYYGIDVHELSRSFGYNRKPKPMSTTCSNRPKPFSFSFFSMKVSRICLVSSFNTISLNHSTHCIMQMIRPY